MRLSKALSAFRGQRQEFNKLIVDLSVNIDRAREAIEGLKTASFEAGEDLQKTVNTAKKLTDELSLMNDSGNALAGRLEKLAEKSRSKVAPGDAADYGQSSVAAPVPEIKATKKSEKSMPSFFIKDRDFDDRNPPVRGATKTEWTSDPSDKEEELEFLSKAERDLYEALQKNKRPGH
jgi:hypothetical protein